MRTDCKGQTVLQTLCSSYVTDNTKGFLNTKRALKLYRVAELRTEDLEDSVACRNSFSLSNALHQDTQLPPADILTPRTTNRDDKYNNKDTLCPGISVEVMTACMNQE